LRKALSLNTSDTRSRPFVIIFLTDGRPTIGTTDEDQIVAGVKKRGEGHTRIFCFGIGTDVNTHLLDKITEETHAFSQYVLPEEVTELARKYSIVTPYTAYLIMEDEGRRNVSMSSRSFQKFDSDVTARKEAAQNWNSFKLENSGEKALADARYGYALRSAQAP